MAQRAEALLLDRAVAEPFVQRPRPPVAVHHIQPLGGGRVRVWAHPHGARVSVESPTHYGTFAEADDVEVAG